MKTIIYRFFLVLLVAHFTGCGEKGRDSQNGDSPEKPSPEEENDEPDSNQEESSVSFHLGEFSQRPDAYCKKNTHFYPFTEGERVRQYRINDPLDDGQMSGELHFFSVDRTQEDLRLSIVFDEGFQGEFLVEFGGLVATGESLLVKQLDAIRISQEKVEIFVGGNWTLLSPNFYNVERHQNSLDLKLFSRFLHHFTTWPAWWIKVQLLAGSSVVDASRTFFFDGDVQPSGTHLWVESCNQWADDNFTEELQFLSFGKVQQDRLNPEVALLVRNIATVATDEIGRMVVSDGGMGVISGIWQEEPTFIPFDLNITNRSRDFQFLNLHSWVSQGVDPNPQQSSAIEMQKQILSRWLGLDKNFENWNFREVVFYFSILDRLQVAQFGERRWLQMFNWSEFVAGENQYAEELIRGRVFGHFLGDLFPAKSLADASKKVQFLDYLQELADAFLKGEKFRELRRTWVDGAEPSAYSSSSNLFDQDGDGIPGYKENSFGSSDKKKDTDQDGWSDLAELLVNSDPAGDLTLPSFVFLDGFVSEWTRLVPQQLLDDRDFGSNCPKQADIGLYSAINSEQGLTVGSSIRGFGGKSRVLWKILVGRVDAKESQFEIIVENGARQIEMIYGDTIKRKLLFPTAAPQGEDGIEIFVASQLMKSISLEDPMVKIQTWTGLDFKQFCDETDWWEPNIKGLPLPETRVSPQPAR